MSTQFYVIWSSEREKDFLKHVQETCKVSIIPAKKADDIYTTPNMTCFFVRKEDARLFRYKRTREDDGDIIRAIYPIVQSMNSLPYIEYSQELQGDKCIGRIYVPGYSKSNEIAKEIMQVFLEIKKWVSENSTLREKIGTIQVYSV